MAQNPCAGAFDSALVRRCNKIIALFDGNRFIDGAFAISPDYAIAFWERHARPFVL